MNNNKMTLKEKEAYSLIQNKLHHENVSPSVREIQNHLKYNSSSSAKYIIDQLVKKKLIYKQNGKIKLIQDDYNKINHNTIDIPLIGTVTCGKPIFAEENYEKTIKISTSIAKPPHKYFLLRAKGDSMNKVGINEGDFVLIKIQQTAKSGDIVLALIDNEATIKEININKNNVVLKPKSTNSENQPIILTKDFYIQGLVVTSFSGID